MTRAHRVLFDACTLENFASVARLDLLETRFSGRAARTDGVAFELRRRAAEQPALRPLVDATWLGSPIAAEDAPAVQQIDRIRRGLGGSPTLPTQHLGEAQSLYHLVFIEPSGTFATDDRDAYLTAQRRGVRVIDTVDILRECYSAGLLGCPEAYELLHKMVAAGRGVAAPPSHWFVCPPADVTDRSDP